MAISSIGPSAPYGGTTAGALLQRANQAYRDTGGRGDSFICASCGQQKAAPQYCATCQGGSSARNSSPNITGKYDSCPTCNGSSGGVRSSGSRAGAAYYHNSSPYINQTTRR
jgi:hypothetical protein